MRSSRPISELTLHNSSRVVGKTVRDDLSRIQRVGCVILTFLYILTASDYNNDLFSDSLISLIRIIGYGIVFLLFLVGPKRHLKFLLSNKLLLALIVLAIASISWSIYPPGTIVNSKSLIKSYLFAVCFVSMYSVRDQIKLVKYALIAGAIMSILVALLMPEITIQYLTGAPALRGIYGHKQYLGMNMLLCSTTFVPFILKSKNKLEFYLNCLGLLFCSSVAYAADSKTAILGILFVVLSFPFYILLSYTYNSGVKIRSLFFIISVLVLLISLVLVVVNYEAIFVDILGKGTDFNGRVPLWILILPEAVKRPILGYGYNGFWPSDIGLSVAYRTSWMQNILYNGVYWNPGEPFYWHAHNGMLQVFLDLGIVGLTLLLLSVGHTCRKVFSKLKIDRLFNSDYTTEIYWMFLMLLIMFFLNVTEVYFLKANDIIWVSYMCAALNLSARRV